MNLDNISAIAIPEGNVKAIHNADNIMLWHRPKVYGVYWDGGSSATMTRTDDSANFASPTIGTGTTLGSSPFDDCYPWKGIEKVTDGNNVLVKIPKFWYMWTNSSSALTLQIADKPVNGFYTSPMHADKGDGIGERDYTYIGRYKCAASTYYSQSGKYHQTTMTIGDARTKIASLGDGYHQFDYAAFWTLRMLYLVEFANWDANAAIPRTSTPESSDTLMNGWTDSMTYHTGTSANGYSNQYRWVEDPWMNRLEWCDGIYFNNGKVYCINNPVDMGDMTKGTFVATMPKNHGYIKNWSVPTASGYEYALFPSSVDSSTSAYIPDYFYQDSGNVLYTGGARSILTQHGAFFLYCDFTATDTSSAIGTRMIKLP